MAVYKEIRSKNSFGYSEIESEFFMKCEVKGKIYLNLLKRDLDDGESEAILLAKEMSADALLIDERIGLQIAKNEGLDCIGTLTILRLAKEMKLISEVKPLLIELKEKGRWYSSYLIQEYLKSINE